MMTASDYLDLYDRAKLTGDAKQLAELGYVCKVALANSIFYLSVQNKTSIPWPLIAAIHFRESSQCFKRHLHNGDPLTARTVHVPAGRPLAGEPPFTWTESACDALSTAWRPKAWTVDGCLEFLERYNGLGYQKNGVNTPYLWDFTDQYVSGLYVADGRFDPNAKESRPGCVAILKMLVEKGVSIEFASSLPGSGELH